MPPQAISAIAPSTIGSATRSHKLGRRRDGQAIRGRPQRCSMLPLADGRRRGGGAYQYPKPGELAKRKFVERRGVACRILAALLASGRRTPDNEPRYHCDGVRPWISARGAKPTSWYWLRSGASTISPARTFRRGCSPPLSTP